MHDIFKVLENLTEKFSIPKMTAWTTINMSGIPTQVRIEIFSNSDSEQKIEGDHIILHLAYSNNWCSLKQSFNFYFKDYTATLEAEGTVFCPTGKRAYDFTKKLPERSDRFQLYEENTPIHKQLDFLEGLLKDDCVKRRLFISYQ